MKKIFTIACNQINRKIAHPINTEEHDNSYLKRKNKGVVKRSKIITQQLEAIENPNIADIKSIIIKYPKTSCKLFNTIRQPAKVSHVGSDKSFNGTLYSETKKESFLNSKITKQSHFFKVYASYYHV